MCVTIKLVLRAGESFFAFVYNSARLVQLARADAEAAEAIRILLSL